MIHNALGSVQVFRPNEACTGCRRCWVSKPHTMTEVSRQQPRNEEHATKSTHLSRAHGAPRSLARNVGDWMATVYEAHKRQLSNKNASLRASHNGNSASFDRILLLRLWKPMRLSSSIFLSGMQQKKGKRYWQGRLVSINNLLHAWYNWAIEEVSRQPKTCRTCRMCAA